MSEISLPKFSKDEFDIHVGEPISETLSKFQGHISAVRSALQQDLIQVEQEGFMTIQVDDLFFLRYILSEKGKINKILSSIRKAFEWRRLHQDDLKQVILPKCLDVPGDTISEHDAHEVIQFINEFKIGQPGEKVRKDIDFLRECLAHGYFLFPFQVAEKVLYLPAQITRPGHCKFATAYKSLGKDQVIYLAGINNERLYRVIDALTRKTKRWTKRVDVLDDKDLSLFHSEFDLHFMRALGNVAKESEFLFPQLVLKKVVINAPVAIQKGMKLFNMIMPKRTMDKVGFCGAKHIWERTDCHTSCPFVKKHSMFPHGIPSSIGGTMKPEDVPKELADKC